MRAPTAQRFANNLHHTEMPCTERSVRHDIGLSTDTNSEQRDMRKKNKDGGLSNMRTSDGGIPGICILCDVTDGDGSSICIPVDFVQSQRIYASAMILQLCVKCASHFGACLGLPLFELASSSAPSQSGCYDHMSACLCSSTWHKAQHKYCL